MHEEENNVQTMEGEVVRVRVIDRETEYARQRERERGKERIQLVMDFKDSI